MNAINTGISFDQYAKKPVENVLRTVIFKSENRFISYK